MADVLDLLRRTGRRIRATISKRATALASGGALALSIYAVWQTHVGAEFQRRVDLQTRYATILERANGIDISDPRQLNEVIEMAFELKGVSELHPESAPAQFLLGELLIELGEYDDAQRAFDRAVELDSTYLDAAMNARFSRFARVVEYSEPIREFVSSEIRKYFEEHPESSVAKYWLSTVYEWEGNFEAAERIADELFVTTPMTCSSLVEYANLKASARKLEESRRFFLMGELLCQRSSRYAMNRGHIHLRLGEPDQAL